MPQPPKQYPDYSDADLQALKEAAKQLDFDKIFPPDTWYTAEVRAQFPNGMSKDATENDWMSGCISYLTQLSEGTPKDSPVRQVLRGLTNARDALKNLEMAGDNMTKSTWDYCMKSLTDIASLQDKLDQFNEATGYAHAQDPRMQAVSGMLKGFINLNTDIKQKAAESEIQKQRSAEEQRAKDFEKDLNQDLDRLVKVTENNSLCLKPEEVSKEAAAFNNDAKAAGEAYDAASAELKKLAEYKKSLQEEIAKTSAKINVIKTQHAIKIYKKHISEKDFNDFLEKRNHAHELGLSAATNDMESWENMRRLKKLTEANTLNFDKNDTSKEDLREEMRSVTGRSYPFGTYTTDRLIVAGTGVMDLLRGRNVKNKFFIQAVDAYDEADVQENGIINKMQDALEKSYIASQPSMPNEGNIKNKRDALKCDFINKTEAYFKSKNDAEYDCKMQGFSIEEDLKKWEQEGWGLTEEQVNKADKEAAARTKELKEKLAQADLAIKAQQEQVDNLEKLSEKLNNQGKALGDFADKLKKEPEHLDQHKKNLEELGNSKLNTEVLKDDRMIALKDRLTAFKNTLIPKAEASHNNSTAFKGMKAALESVMNSFDSGIAPTSAQLEAVRDSARDYLAAKKDDWHIGSKMRYRRLAYAQQLMAYADRSAKTVAQVNADREANLQVVTNNNTLKMTYNILRQDDVTTADLIKIRIPQVNHTEPEVMHSKLEKVRKSLNGQVKEAVKNSVACENVKAGKVKFKEEQVVKM